MLVVLKTKNNTLNYEGTFDLGQRSRHNVSTIAVVEYVEKSTKHLTLATMNLRLHYTSVSGFYLCKC